MDRQSVGKKINCGRKKRKMTQKDLADLLHVSDKAVSKWETGKSYPDIEIMTDLAEALEISVEELLDLKETKVERVLDTVAVIVADGKEEKRKTMKHMICMLALTILLVWTTIATFYVWPIMNGFHVYDKDDLIVENVENKGTYIKPLNDAGGASLLYFYQTKEDKTINLYLSFGGDATQYRNELSKTSYAMQGYLQPYDSWIFEPYMIYTPAEENDYTNIEVGTRSAHGWPSDNCSIQNFNEIQIPDRVKAIYYVEHVAMNEIEDYQAYIMEKSTHAREDWIYGRIERDKPYEITTDDYDFAFLENAELIWKRE